MKKNKRGASNVNKTMKASLKKYFPIFMLPTLIAFSIGFVWPFLWGIYLSFFKFKTLKFTEFNGIQNYILAFKDNTFLNAFNFTAVFSVVAVILINICAFALALALTSKVKGSTIFRTIFFMPNLVGGIVLAYVWKSILNELIYIIFNSQLVLETTYGFWSLIILLYWQQIGYMMIIYIAGLQSVPSEYVEAARIDGASSWQLLTKITIPTVMPSITICLFLSLTNSFKLFDQNFALTNGSPNRTTEMMALNIYNSFYQSATNMGVGQAKAVVFFVIVAAISLIQLAITKRREVQQ
jgi:raffinose/stachyose/melibiose transport system permease protein